MSALDDIEKVLRQLKDRGAEMAAFEGLLAEIGSALADVVGLLEKGAKREATDLAPLVKAIAGLKLEPRIEVKAPSVQVNVPQQEPPTVVVNPPAHAPDWTALEVKLNKGRTGTGPLESLTITKLK